VSDVSVLDLEDEEDVFRLAIRGGHALIEQRMSEVIAEAFEGNVPSELKNLTCAEGHRAFGVRGSRRARPASTRRLAIRGGSSSRREPQERAGA